MIPSFCMPFSSSSFIPKKKKKGKFCFSEASQADACRVHFRDWLSYLKSKVVYPIRSPSTMCLIYLAFLAVLMYRSEDFPVVDGEEI